ncbi:hypothetical protein B0T17DRAFT_389329 [Bombardia bombarda]|uniref:Mid2 domain-containing protein n=1 Tax=Bombardia bombarda TaxID=252184 RepID=A0AA39U6L0_9PEZI|nr:hypothetical protein B0T17DRAFT_389329 [Bombardia bombarda]
MRISTWQTWLVAALTVGVGNVKGDTLEFDDIRGSLANESYAIFTTNSADPGAESKTFKWKVNNDSLQIDRVNLYQSKSDGSIEQIAFGKRPENNLNVGSPTTPSVLDPTLSRRQEDSAPTGVITPVLEVTSSPGEGSVTIPDIRDFVTSPGYPLYFEAVWPGNKGFSYSEAFTIVNGTDQTAINGAVNSGKYQDSKPFKIESNSTNSNINPNISPSGSLINPSTASSPAANSLVGTTSTPTAVPVSSSDGGGLSTGAIIGIAVACGIAGLAILSTVVWLILRRRLRNKGIGGPGGRPYGIERNRTDELMAEKEANAGGADLSPHSPYSDDGGIGGGIGIAHSEEGPIHYGSGSLPNNGTTLAATAATAAMLTHHNNQTRALPTASEENTRSFSPYSDHTAGAGVGAGSPHSTHFASAIQSEEPVSATTTTRGGMASPVPGRGTPSSGAVPTQYAHLVEDGMTEDEIRRLEEEERQLDAAIEQAEMRGIAL